MEDLQKINNLKNIAIPQIICAVDHRELERVRIAFLGRKGKLTQM